jgi:hypothetical protein
MATRPRPRKPARIRNRIAIAAIQRKGGAHPDRKKRQQKEACRDPVDDDGGDAT